MGIPAHSQNGEKGGIPAPFLPVKLGISLQLVCRYANLLHSKCHSLGLAGLLPLLTQGATLCMARQVNRAAVSSRGLCSKPSPTCKDAFQNSGSEMTAGRCLKLEQLYPLCFFCCAAKMRSTSLSMCGLGGVPVIFMHCSCSSALMKAKRICCIGSAVGEIALGL